MDCTFKTSYSRVQNGKQTDSHVNVLTTRIQYPGVKIPGEQQLKKRTMGVNQRIFVHFLGLDGNFHVIQHLAVEGVSCQDQQSAVRLFTVFLETPPWCDLPMPLVMLIRAYLLQLSKLIFKPQMYKRMTQAASARNFDESLQCLLEQVMIFDSSVMRQTVLEVVHNDGTCTGVYMGSTKDTVTLQYGPTSEQKYLLPRASIVEVRTLTLPELVARYNALQPPPQQSSVA